MTEKIAPEISLKPPVPVWKQRLLKYVITPAVLFGGAACGPVRAPDISPLKQDKATEQTANQFTISKAFPLPENYHESPQLPFFNDIILGADQGGSVQLPNGNRLFIFGDTYMKTTLNNGQEGWTMPRSSAAIVDEKTNTFVLITGPKDKDGRETSWLTPKENDGSYYWPLSPFLANNGKDLIVPVIKNIPSNPNDPPNYFGNYGGIDFVKLKFTHDSPYPQFDSIVELPRPDADSNKRTYWGAAAFTQIDPETNRKYTYIYGTTVNEHEDPSKVTRDLKVARVPDGDVTNLAKWEFWNGKKWSTSNGHYINAALTTETEKQAELWQNAESTAEPIVMDEDMNDIFKCISSTFSVLNINGKVVLINKPGEFWSNEVTAAVAYSPQGPFGKNQTIIDEVLPYNTDPSLRSEKGEVTSYSAVAYLDKNGKLIVSVSRNFLPNPKTTADEQRLNGLTFVKNKGYIIQNFVIDPNTIIT